MADITHRRARSHTTKLQIKGQVLGIALLTCAVRSMHHIISAFSTHGGVKCLYIRANNVIVLRMRPTLPDRLTGGYV